MKEPGNNLFVTGTDTGVGKTLVSAILTLALEADYWKPVQCGDLHQSDRQEVARLTGLPAERLHPEAYALELAQSPHLAAAHAGVSIGLEAFTLPRGARRLVVEGAGGVLVPLNQEDFIIDLAAKFRLSVVLVCRSYLGCINHSLLSIEAIRRRGLHLAGLVFSGKPHFGNEDFIAARADTPILLRIAEEAELNPKVVAAYAQKLQEQGGLR